MRSALGDGAVDQDNDLVSVADSRSAVGNQNCRAPLHDSAQAIEDALLGLRVHGGKGIEERILNGLRSEEHTSELQSLTNLVCRLLLEKKKNKKKSLSGAV